MVPKPLLLNGNGGLHRIIDRWMREGQDHTQEPREISVEGPAGTGKTFACLLAVDRVCREIPGFKWAMARKVKADVNTMLCPAMEEDIYAPTDPVVNDGRTIRGRQEYVYPNGSRIEYMGFDNPQRWRTGQWDGLYVNEGTHLLLDDWQLAVSRIRRGHTYATRGVPFHPIIVDTNPDDPFHWLNIRPDTPARKYPNRMQMHRIRTLHTDNPRYWDVERNCLTIEGEQYVAELDNLTGATYLRLRKGIWAAAEGQVYDEWDAARHVVDYLPSGPRGWDPFKRRFAAIDWGFRDPAVVLVIGVDDNDRAWVLHQIYMSRQTVPWLVGKCEAIHETWDVETFVVPHDRPDNTQLLMDAGLPVHQNQTRDIATGIDAVRDRLRDIYTGQPGLAVYEGSLEERDEVLVSDRRPWSLVQEMTSYAYPIMEDGKPVKDKPIDMNNHALDALRYGVCYLDLVGAGTREDAGYAAGTYGHDLGHDELREQSLDQTGWRRPSRLDDW